MHKVSECGLFVSQTVGHLGEGQGLALSPLLLLPWTHHDGEDQEMQGSVKGTTLRPHLIPPYWVPPSLCDTGTHSHTYTLLFTMGTGPHKGGSHSISVAHLGLPCPFCLLASLFHLVFGHQPFIQTFIQRSSCNYFLWCHFSFLTFFYTQILQELLFMSLPLSFYLNGLIFC